MRRWSKRLPRARYAQGGELSSRPEGSPVEDGIVAFFDGPMDGQYMMFENNPVILEFRRISESGNFAKIFAYQLVGDDYVFIGERQG